MISAKIIADSLSCHGDRITTWELVYPRFIHSELMTHRMFSRNAASSRAIPIQKMMDMVETDPAMPIYWGLNQPGMQAAGEHSNLPTCIWAWEEAAKSAVEQAKVLQNLGLHKQIVNRVLEPFQWMKTIVTATEWNNWYALRDHEAAQPEIHALAKLMAEKIKDSEPEALLRGEYHLPYVSAYQKQTLGIEDLIKISSSCCAQVSYRLLDDGIEKALMIYGRLVESKPVHASPFEHVAKVMRKTVQHYGHGGEEGVTHIDRHNRFWSGNFKGFIQHRQLIKDNVVRG